MAYLFGGTSIAVNLPEMPASVHSDSPASPKVQPAQKNGPSLPGRAVSFRKNRAAKLVIGSTVGRHHGWPFALDLQFKTRS